MMGENEQNALHCGVPSDWIGRPRMDDSGDAAGR